MSIYSAILERAMIPSYYTLRRRSYGAYRKVLEKSQWWSPERLAEFQWNETCRLLDHAFSSVPFYQRKYAEFGIRRGEIKSPDDLRKLPPLTRAELNSNRQDLRSTKFRGKLIPHATGGSSGEPARFFITTDSFDWRMAASARAYSWSGCRVGDRTLYLWGAPVGEIPTFKAIKTKLFRTFRRELIFNTFRQTEDFWRRVYESTTTFRPRFIVGYVASLEEFCRFLLRSRLSVPTIEAAIAAAETVLQPTRDLVQEALGVELFNTYGSREFMSMAAECSEHNGLHIHSENILLETEWPAEKGPSEILVTDLHNYGMPFIRYRIGDLGVAMHSGPCRCGRGLPRLASVEGRVLDALRTRTGKVVPGIIFPHVFKDIPEIVEFQVEQKDLDDILVLAVLKEPLSSRSHDLIRSEFGKAFEAEVNIQIRPVDAIPKRPSGKKRVTIGMPPS